MPPALVKQFTLKMPMALAVAILASCGGGAGVEGDASASSDQSMIGAEELRSPQQSAPAPELVSKFDPMAAGHDAKPVSSLSPEPGLERRPRITAVTLDAIAPAINLYVATTGNDALSGQAQTVVTGTNDGPLQSLPAVQGKVRQLLVDMNMGITARRPINVIVEPGTYQVKATWTFDPRDSGIQGAPVTYMAQTPGSVLISGGEILGTVRAAAAGSIVQFPSPKSLVPTQMKGAGQLFISGKRATLARQPNAGSYWFVQQAVAATAEPVADRGKEAFVATKSNATWMKSLTASDRARAVVNIRQSWTSGLHRFNDVAVPAGAIRVSPRAKWPFLTFGADQRYFIENTTSALDASGEWIWDATGVRYIADAADAGKNVTAVMPTVATLLSVQGNAALNDYVHDLQFRNIGFAHTRFETPDVGFLDSQAAVGTSAAIEVDAARNIVFDKCNVSGTGGYGLWLRESVRDSVVSGNEITDTGAGGIRIGLPTQLPEDPNATGANVVSNNRVTETGKIFPGAVGIWVGQSFDNEISQNLIANTSYSGISVGWKWGYATAPTSGRNVIRNNVLVNIGRGELSDLGAIYTLGEAPGTLVTGNVIREVRAYQGFGAGAWGLYNDEGSSGMTAQNNVVVGTDSGAYHLHYGRTNLVSGNIFADGDLGELQVSRSDPLTRLSVANNTIVNKVVSPFLKFATAPDVQYGGNSILPNVQGLPTDASKCGAGCAQQSMALTTTTDPRGVLLQGANADVSAVLSQTLLNAGPQDGLALPSVASSLQQAQLAPPLPLQIDIAGTSTGLQPLGMRYTSAAPTKDIQVVSKTGAPGGKCLLFADSSLQSAPWEPFAYTHLNHRTGTTTSSFRILGDANTNFIHEWRDNAVPYKVGPSLRILQGRLWVGGKAVATIKAGSWYTVKIVAQTGVAGGTWSLTVTDSSKKPVTVSVTKLPMVSSTWKELNWIGYVSDAVTTSNTCLASMSVSSTASQ
ncbi:MAG: right-handed parallel beta-helix repeat-containing protein [Burkholderiales bacterium]|nr:right-handed parallel beta-helix repeat-containing protein [Burkholderiales bacterium]